MSPFDFSGPPLTKHERKPQQTPLFNGHRSPTNHRGSITVVGAIQGAIDAHRRDAIKQGAAI